MAIGDAKQETGADIRALLRAGLAQHNAGRLDEAEQAYLAALAGDRDNSDAHNLLCALCLQRGDHERALAHGKSAVAARTDIPLYWNNYGVALRRNGEAGAALTAFEKALALAPEMPDALSNIAGLQAEAGAYEDAEAAYRAILKQTPDRALTHVRLGQVLQAQARLQDAVAAWETAIGLDPTVPVAWVNIVGACSAAGQYADARSAFERAEAAGVSSPDLSANMAWAELAQGNTDTACELAETGLLADRTHIGCAIVLGAGRLDSGDAHAAERLARQVTVAAPENADGWALLAGCLERLRRSDEAVTAYEQALEIEPQNLDALSNLADLSERTNRLDRAETLVTQVLAIAPDHPFGNRIAATLARRSGDSAAGIGILARLADAPAPPRVRQGIQFELGRLHDREGQYTQAFAHFLNGNRIQSEGVASRRHDPADYRLDVAACRDVLTSGWIESWTPSPLRAGEAPVFLVGFPRSGTTLLDQILDSHPALQVVEEKPMMEELRREVERMSGGYPDTLAGLDQNQLTALREMYWRRVDDFVARVPGSILVDKLPLNIEKVVLIHRVFPDAKFILALRHPADCVLSCFMQSFRPNISMNNFHTVEDAARLYDLVFGLWEKTRSLIDLEVYEIRYEELVADMPGALGRLLGFLGLAWDDALLDYAENARGRGQINTPSYNQVTEPIYARARGRWVRYREAMAGALETLTPWIERYGYDAAVDHDHGLQNGGGMPK